MNKNIILIVVVIFACMSFSGAHFMENARAAEAASQKYYYATATAYGVKMRNGPGIQYKENNLRLNKNAYANAPREILYDDYLFGLIVDDTRVKGDDACSAWQKIIVVHTSWDSEEILKPLCEAENGTNNFACSETAYICKDFIKTSPVDYTGLSKNALMEYVHKLSR